MSDDTLDLGDGHIMIFAEYNGEPRVGANIKHKKPDGTECNGWISFAGRAWANSFKETITTWTLEQENPITLSPSILCRSCGDHGYVREGKWVRA